MIIRRLLLIGAAACALGATLLAVGCGSGDTNAPEPLSMKERVIGSDLGGLKTDGAPQYASTPEAFAKLADPEQPDEEAALLRKAGFVAGAFKRYNVDEAFGLSGAIQYGTSQQAIGELARLDKEFSSDLPSGATQGVLAGVPGSRTITATTTENGKPFALGAALFTDGPFLYVQSAVGPQDVVIPQGVVDAASALYLHVKGRPAP